MVADRARARLIRDIRTLAGAGKPASDIARDLDVSRDVVRGICIAHGIACVKGRAGKRANPDAIIPAWVPADLRGGYLARAKTDGEEAAASWARKMKAEAAR